MVLALLTAAVLRVAAPSAPEDDKLANFVLQRGLYVAADFGTFVSLGDTNGVSNLQPYVALHLGYDLTDNLSLQASASAAYVAENPISPYDDPAVTPGGTAVTSYDLLNLTGELVYALRVTQRFAIEPKVGAGFSRINPLPTDPDDPTAYVPRMNLALVGGLGLTYLTLLTDFSAGIAATFLVLPGPGIVGVGTSFSVRYTF
ncbi:MAG: adventurous gliding motility protein CglE [Myxococcota bacterium]